MHYLALGDSISIDDYTGVPGGGAASQLARLLDATHFQDLTRDGNVAEGVLRDLALVKGRPDDLITLTVGGNNLLMGHAPEYILPLIDQIAGKIQPYHAQTIINTIYDPTDGDDTLAQEIGLPLELRGRYRAVNAGIIKIAAQYRFTLADLEALFHGHGIRSEEPWLTQVIEPNYAGATAIARCWVSLLSSTQ